MTAGETYRYRLNLAEETRRRITATRLKESERDVLGKRDRSVDQWLLTVPHGEHSHEATMTRKAHPRLRGLNAAAHADLVSMTAANVPSGTIGTVLRKSGHLDEVAMEDIYIVR